MFFKLVEDGKNHIFSVQELNIAAKQTLENGLPLLWVRGEISNFAVSYTHLTLPTNREV